MRVGDVVSAMGLEVLVGADGLDREVMGGYASDLLSCVMAGAEVGDVWVTLQAHQNVVAVASLTGVACVVITEGARPDTDTVARAEREGVILLATQEDTFCTVVGLARLGLEA